jgi:hypothetical protein
MHTFERALLTERTLRAPARDLLVARLMRLFAFLSGGALIACTFSLACWGRVTESGTADTSPNQRAPTTDVPPRDDGFCENGSLDFGPATLPSGPKGVAYRVVLGDYAEDGWYGESYYGSSNALPPGLKLTGKSPKSALVVEGVPTKAGSFELTVYAGHGLDSNGCSTMPDPHTFTLEITDGDAGYADAGSTDASID